MSALKHFFLVVSGRKVSAQAVDLKYAIERKTTISYARTKNKQTFCQEQNVGRRLEDKTQLAVVSAGDQEDCKAPMHSCLGSVFQRVRLRNWPVGSRTLK